MLTKVAFDDVFVAGNYPHCNIYTAKVLESTKQFLLLVALLLKTKRRNLTPSGNSNLFIKFTFLLLYCKVQFYYVDFVFSFCYDSPWKLNVHNLLLFPFPKLHFWPVLKLIRQNCEVKFNVPSKTLTLSVTLCYVMLDSCGLYQLMERTRWTWSRARTSLRQRRRPRCLCRSCRVNRPRSRLTPGWTPTTRSPARFYGNVKTFAFLFLGQNEP